MLPGKPCGDHIFRHESLVLHIVFALVELARQLILMPYAICIQRPRKSRCKCASIQKAHMPLSGKTSKFSHHKSPSLTQPQIQRCKLMILIQ